MAGDRAKAATAAALATLADAEGTMETVAAARPCRG